MLHVSVQTRKLTQSPTTSSYKVVAGRPGLIRVANKLVIHIYLNHKSLTIHTIYELSHLYNHHQLDITFLKQMHYHEQPCVPNYKSHFDSSAL